MILQLEVLKQELIDAAANYKTAVSHPNKDLLITIKVPLKILTLQLQNHQNHSSMALNLNPNPKVEDSIQIHRLHKEKTI